MIHALNFSDDNECASGPCQHGGTCTDRFNEYSCQCAPGWEGDNCEINVNECQSSPCVNGGSCMDDVNRFRCDCVEGYQGTFCEESKSTTNVSLRMSIDFNHF